MKGLLEGQAEQTAPARAPQQGRPSPSATEFDQEAIDIFTANGMKMIHNPKASDSIVKFIMEAKNPVTAIADSVLRIVERLEETSAAAGKQPSLNTIAVGGNMLMGEIIASAEAAGLKKLTDKEKYQAYSLAISKYLDEAIKTGKMTKEQVLQMSNEVQATPEGQKIVETAAAGPTPGQPPPGTLPNAAPSRVPLNRGGGAV